MTVDTGEERFKVICGAPNVAAGQMIAYAKLGARLIDGHSGKPTVLKKAKIRGVESAGMVCSEKELGLSDEHEGILVLSEDAPIGSPLSEYLGDSARRRDVVSMKRRSYNLHRYPISAHLSDLALAGPSSGSPEATFT